MTYSYDRVERGIAKYMDTELIPKLPCDGIRGFGIGVCATLLTRRCTNLLQGLEKNAIIRDMGVIKDGAVDIDLLADACKQNIPASGLTVSLPMGITLRINASDIDTICRCITEG